MTVTSTELTYQVDGITMRSRFYLDDAISEKRPCILVFPDARGLDDCTYNGARRLAEEGYAALACDFYGEGRYIPDPQEAIPFAKALISNPKAMTAGGRAAVTALATLPGVDISRIGAMGYCLGGNVAVELARSGMPFAAAIAYHGGAVPPNPEQSRNITGKILLCLGARDPMVPVEMRNRFEAEMVAANVDFRMHIYGTAYHSFTNPDAHTANMPDTVRYDPEIEERSWGEMKALLAEVFSSAQKVL